MTKILTIDVWDTLLRREVHPDAIKLATSKYFFKLCSGRIKKLMPDHLHVHKLRRAFEKQLYQDSLQNNQYGEYHIEQVIRAMATVLCPDKSEHDELVAQIIDYEIGFEKQVLSKDPDIEETLASIETDEVMFLSDFYMSANTITELLIYADVPEQYTQGISSCDVKCNKHTGSIYKYLHQTLAITPQDHVHIGDSKLSDFKMPKSLGISAHLYRPVPQHAARRRREKLYQHPKSYFSEQLKDAIQISESSQKLTTAHYRPYRLGIQYSQLFIGFIQSVNEEIIKHDIDAVYFLSREGAFLKQIYDALKTNIDPQLGLPEGRHLEVSRASTFLASLKQVNLPEMMRVWKQINTMSLHGLLCTLNIDIPEICNYIQHKKIDRYKKRKKLWLDHDMIALFSDKDFIQLCECERRRQQDALLNYLSSEGIDRKDSKNILFVDVGWRGTIQDNIAHLMPRHHYFGKYLCMDKLLNYQANNVSKSAYLYDANKNAKDWCKLKDIVVLEILCNSAEGSVVGYQKEYPHQPLRHCVEGEITMHHEHSYFFQQGVIEVSHYLSKAMFINTLCSTDLHTKSLRIYRAITTIRNPYLRRVFKRGVAHNQLFAYGEVIIKKSCMPKIIRKYVKRLLKAKEYLKIG